MLRAVRLDRLTPEMFGIQIPSPEPVSWEPLIITQRIRVCFDDGGNVTRTEQIFDSSAWTGR